MRYKTISAYILIYKYKDTSWSSVQDTSWSKHSFRIHTELQTLIKIHLLMIHRHPQIWLGYILIYKPLSRYILHTILGYILSHKHLSTYILHTLLDTWATNTCQNTFWAKTPPRILVKKFACALLPDLGKNFQLASTDKNVHGKRHFRSRAALIERFNRYCTTV